MFSLDDFDDDFIDVCPMCERPWNSCICFYDDQDGDMILLEEDDEE
jgi:hypothetical protein